MFVLLSCAYLYEIKAFNSTPRLFYIIIDNYNAKNYSHRPIVAAVCRESNRIPDGRKANGKS